MEKVVGHKMMVGEDMAIDCVVFLAFLVQFGVMTF